VEKNLQYTRTYGNAESDSRKIVMGKFLIVTGLIVYCMVIITSCTLLAYITLKIVLGG
jgi:hypothetical protein